MSQKKAQYITTTLPYVNADPHIGFALEILQADAFARYSREKLGSDNVFFNTGSDEHGQKIFEAADKAGKDVKEYVDLYAGKFEELKKSLNLSYDKFIRTTDEDHVKAAEVMWKRCKDKGDIYEKEFEGLYCVGCERYLTERDMADGKCVIHDTEPRLMKEKNWFFRFSKYAPDLLKYLERGDSIVPNWRREEALNFVKDGLEDFSISREKSRLSWGIPVPDDATQVMYVWFDALTNYISTLGWPKEEGSFEKFWINGHTLQMAGKDQVRFQSLMFQAMLMSADVKPTDQVFYHGFITSGGQKMSKSLGNVISPFDLVEKYGTDATRYLLLRHVHSTEDTDVTWERLDEWYNAGLANGLGNLVARVMKMAEDNLDESTDWSTYGYAFDGYPKEKIEEYRFDLVIDYIWDKIAELDREIQEKKPWETKDKEIIKNLSLNLYRIGKLLEPFMPKIAEKIVEATKANKKPENLFPRLNA